MVFLRQYPYQLVNKGMIKIILIAGIILGLTGCEVLESGTYGVHGKYGDYGYKPNSGVNIQLNLSK